MARDRRRVIVLGPDAALRVRNGALDIEHGPAVERVRLKVDIDDDMPCAILFDGRGEFMTGEAVRWCTRRGIGLVLPDGPGRMVTIVHSALEAADGETLRDVGPAIIRAQCAADPVRVAREIVRAKIAADAKAIGPRLTARGFDVARYEAKLAAARSVAEIMVIEAKAAAAYWRSHRDLGLVERKGGNLPRTWLRFANRGKGAEFLGNKHASHPISAMINYCVVVEAGRLARALAGEGMALQIGFLHGDKHGRNSLVWDCIEPLRAKINARVFAFIAGHEFGRSRLSGERDQRSSARTADHRRTFAAMSFAGARHSRRCGVVKGFGHAVRRAIAASRARQPALDPSGWQWRRARREDRQRPCSAFVGGRLRARISGKDRRRGADRRQC